MENENKKAYSEVIEILKTIDSEKRLEALPMEMLELLKSKADPEYKPTICTEVPLDEQNLQPETLSILSWIALKYWKDEIDNVESNIIDEEKAENDKQDEIENAFEEINEQDNAQETENILPILHEDCKWYQKIKIKIIEFFRKFFGKNKTSKLITEEKGNNL